MSNSITPKVDVISKSYELSGRTLLKRSLLKRKLRVTRSDLLDPSQHQLRISEIAFRRGFNDSAYFSRSYRNRFGISPTKLRRKTKQFNTLQ